MHQATWEFENNIFPTKCKLIANNPQILLRYCNSDHQLDLKHRNLAVDGHWQQRHQKFNFKDYRIHV